MSKRSKRKSLVYRPKTIKATEPKFFNPKTSRRIINEYHVLLKRLKLHQYDGEQEKLELERRIKEGLDTYQKASLLGQSKERGGDSSKWLLQYLDLSKPLSLLDVGALKNNYKNLKNITAKCIDLNAQNEEIEQIDFFEYKLEKGQKPYDVVCLSLVLNFVDTPTRRGIMLQRVLDLLKENGGYLYIVLPLACVENSRYMDNKLFIEIVTSFGFKLLQEHKSTKLAYWLFERTPAVGVKKLDVKKKELRKGSNRNNFFVCNK